MKKSNQSLVQGVLIATGIIMILLSFVILGLSLWEGFGGLAGKFQQVTLPGFHELNLKSSGPYAGLYQHRGPGPMPVKDLNRLDVRIMSKGDYQNVQVYKASKIFDRLGQKGMILFQFQIDEPGEYTMSGVYLDGDVGPTVPVLVFAQAAQSIKQTLIVGGLFFLLFMGLGIFILIKVSRMFKREKMTNDK